MNTPNTPFDSEQLEFQEEWLSAYLDDELSPAQRAVVEERLTHDSYAKHVLDDLKRVRQLVVGMPAWTGNKIQVPVAGSDNPQNDLSSTLASTETIGDDFERVVEVDDATFDWQAETKSRSSSSRSVHRWLRPVAIAASVLAMLGVGYALWPSGPFQRELARSFPTADSIAVPTEPENAPDDSPTPSGLTEGDTESRSIASSLPSLSLLPPADSRVEDFSAAPVPSADASDLALAGAGENAGSREEQGKMAFPERESLADSQAMLEPTTPYNAEEIAGGSALGGAQGLPDLARSKANPAPDNGVDLTRTESFYKLPGPIVAQNSLLDRSGMRSSESVLSPPGTTSQIESNPRIRVARSSVWTDRQVALGLSQVRRLLGRPLIFSEDLGDIAVEVNSSRTLNIDAQQQADDQLDAPMTILNRAEPSVEDAFQSQLSAGNLQWFSPTGTSVSPTEGTDGLIVLFVARAEATQIMKERNSAMLGDTANSLKPEGRALQERASNSILWITSVGAEESGKSADRVILLLTPAEN